MSDAAKARVFLETARTLAHAREPTAEMIKAHVVAFTHFVNTIADEPLVAMLVTLEEARAIVENTPK